MLNVPKTHLEHLEKIGSLTEDERNNISNLIGEIGTKNSLDEFADFVADKSGIERKKVLPLFVIAGSILNTAARLNKTKDSVFNELIDAATINVDSFSFANESKELLYRLLDSETVLASTKCERLKNEYDSKFESIKMITDLRPIFSEDASKICHTAVVHTMDLSIIKNDEVLSHFISLDDADIETIFCALERAKQKSITLKKFIEGEK